MAQLTRRPWDTGTNVMGSPPSDPTSSEGHDTLFTKYEQQWDEVKAVLVELYGILGLTEGATDLGVIPGAGAQVTDGSAVLTAIAELDAAVGDAVVLPAGYAPSSAGYPAALDPHTQAIAKLHYLVSLLDEARRPAGAWDATTAFPTTGAAGSMVDGEAIQAGFMFDVTVAGTQDGQDFEVGDQVLALADGGGATYAGNWLRMPRAVDLDGITPTVRAADGVGTPGVSTKGSPADHQHALDVIPELITADTTVTLDPATGSGVTRVFVLDATGPVLTIQPTAGEALNGAPDGTKVYDSGNTHIVARDVAAGDWSIGSNVAFSAGSDDLYFKLVSATAGTVDLHTFQVRRTGNYRITCRNGESNNNQFFAISTSPGAVNRDVWDGDAEGRVGTSRQEVSGEVVLTKGQNYYLTQYAGGGSTIANMFAEIKYLDGTTFQAGQLQAEPLRWLSIAYGISGPQYTGDQPTTVGSGYRVADLAAPELVTNGEASWVQGTTIVVPTTGTYQSIVAYNDTSSESDWGLFINGVRMTRTYSGNSSTAGRDFSQPMMLELNAGDVLEFGSSEADNTPSDIGSFFWLLTQWPGHSAVRIEDAKIVVLTGNLAPGTGVTPLPLPPTDSGKTLIDAHVMVEFTPGGNDYHDSYQDAGAGFTIRHDPTTNVYAVSNRAGGWAGAVGWRAVCTYA